MGTTSIEWTSGPNGEEGYTFNPWLGCSKVHTGCTNCYAEVSQAVSMRKGGGIQWGEVWQGGQRVVVADSTWKHPLTWARKAAATGQRRKVFCASLADALEVPALPKEWPSSWGQERRERAAREVNRASHELDEARERLWPIIEDTAWMCGGCGRPCAHSSDTLHRKVRLQELDSVGATCEGQNGRCLTTPMGGLDFLLLTKRPENAGLVPEWARPIIWLGTSISDQKTADEMVPRLLGADGFQYRFLSMEPLLGPVNLEAIAGENGIGLHSRDVLRGRNTHHDDGDQYTVEPWAKIDWVVAGGESGSKARPCNVEWIRNILQQCREAGVPAFCKQLGANVEGWPSMSSQCDDDGKCCALKHPKGGDMEEWPKDLRVQMFPGQSWEN